MSIFFYYIGILCYQLDHLTPNAISFTTFVRNLEEEHLILLVEDGEGGEPRFFKASHMGYQGNGYWLLSKDVSRFTTIAF